ncbi:hypothetical protein [Leucobacter massiliensis]|uniref:Uncharacterized protein n=1 Tax=Leucobacter massiliensis TaxID=1686285 RepID=A0A2S9QLP8_9MICO|nr:hypothetical protein [Leucobacter massiliensis]PRI10512.1 hypothetical protein B4915_10930 [Leucobacter massiliensis]
MTENNNNQPHVTVNITPNSRAYDIVGTLLGMGSLAALAWAISTQGWVELASTGATMILFRLVSTMVTAGLIVLPEKDRKGDFEATSGLLRTAWADYQRFQANSPVWRLVLLAVGYTAVFLIVRWLIGLALLIFTNIWVAVAAGLALGMFIIAPKLIGDGLRNLKSKTGVRVNTKAALENDTKGAGA